MQLCVDLDRKMLVKPETDGFKLTFVDVVELEPEDLELVEHLLGKLSEQFASCSFVPFGPHLITTWSRFQLAHWQQSELMLGEKIAAGFRAVKFLPPQVPFIN